MDELLKALPQAVPGGVLAAVIYLVMKDQLGRLQTNYDQLFKALETARKDDGQNLERIVNDVRVAVESNTAVMRSLLSDYKQGK